jgi:glycosyltransferase involved in cell wall biosynthesis
MLKCLHKRHEIHFVAFENPDEPEGPARAEEYCTRAYPVRRRVPAKGSPAFFLQLAAGLFSEVPVAISRFRSTEMGRLISHLLDTGGFDRAVCDFLAPSAHYPDLPHCVLFQHNVETMIWRRSVEHASGPARLYLDLQAKRMFEFEKRVCRETGCVVAVSEADAEMMQRMFDVPKVWAIPTGVNIDYFMPPANPVAPAADLVFVGSMDWRPNVDGIRYFAAETLPLIRREIPDCRVAVVGRTPPPDILALAEADPHMEVTGTVPDVRPYLWGAKLSIVPLRIGGGTRLKIYESMAAKVAVVSTAVGAEGLDYDPGLNIAIGDKPEEFAGACVDLLRNSDRRSQMAEAAWHMVCSRFSWDKVAREFEEILAGAPAASHSLREMSRT